jgi:energy-converting hydrogenase Eha subunit C
MGANTTYLFIDSATMVVLAEFTFMFGLCNIGMVVHIAGSRYLVKSVRELIFDSEDCVVEIMLDFDGKEKSELYDYNNYKEHTVKIIQH